MNILSLLPLLSDQPEVTIGNSVIFAAKLGDSIDIIAAMDINGNPTPSLTWFDPNNTAISYGGRFLQNVEGTLTIQDLELTDFGNYRFVASNDIGNNADVNLSLIQLSKSRLNYLIPWFVHIVIN